tara:strand:+ start:55 stop:633 length:579 start_codon:yes stop_codon:yes gene_type:complete
MQLEDIHFINNDIGIDIGLYQLPSDYNLSSSLIRVCENFELKYEIKNPCLFRGTKLIHLKKVIENGIDTNPFYGSDYADKALEYGNEDFEDLNNGKILIMLDLFKIKRSGEEIEANTNDPNINILRKKYKKEILRNDKKAIWLTMFEDRRHPIHYEQQYGYWIPPKTKNFLKGIIILYKKNFNIMQKIEKIL